MGFVKTPEEVARIQETLSHPRFVNAEMLMVDFLTEPEIVARVLPPGLEPTEEPRITAMVGRWQSNCVGDFHGGAIYVAARRGDIVADYVLAMYMNQDAAIVFGRDVLGEPKKLAQSGLNRRGGSATGWIERGGVRILELEGELTVDHGPTEAQGANFNVKAQPSSTGVGLEHDATLTLAEFDNALRVNREGAAAVRLGGTVHDPLDELEVVSVLRARYVEGDLISSARSIATIPADDFLPYALGRLDDWSALDTEARSLATASR